MGITRAELAQGYRTKRTTTTTTTITTTNKKALNKGPRPERLTFDLKPMRRPISQEIVAWRLIFVIPNKAKYNMFKRTYETSYHRKYWVYIEGDFNEGYVLTNDRFMKCLRDHNIDVGRLIAESDIAQALLKMAHERQTQDIRYKE